MVELGKSEQNFRKTLVKKIIYSKIAGPQLASLQILESVTPFFIWLLLRETLFKKHLLIIVAMFLNKALPTS